MVDVWYKDKRNEINGMDCYFNDLDAHYRGNLYADGRAVGDYTAKDSAEVERIAAAFNISFAWN